MTEAERLAALRARLGIPGIVDVHTHFMPHNVMRKVWAYFDQVGPLTGREWPITYRAGEEERLATLRSFGVRAFTSLVYPHKPEMAAWLNAWTASFAAATPDCLHTATCYPEPEAKTYVAEAVEAGARVFKVHIQVGAFAPDDPLLDPVWGILSDARVPVVIHCGSGPAPGEFTGPGRIAGVLRRFPHLPLIIAHMGTPEYTEFLDLAERYEDVRLDTTMVWTDFSEENAPYPRAEYGRVRDLGERILFGSDFPNIPYRYAHAVEALERLELGDEWVRKVLYDNAAQLFGIEGSV
ncbi:amidohydrolase family protein [Nocardia sp. NPDC050697]|uniref:amidohydrolase family protein n=1 Tax=Nocardia sp. NPDC050697 TaxID=3155158 RepID=UPI0033E05733